jgi:hypothetical protein
LHIKVPNLITVCSNFGRYLATWQAINPSKWFEEHLDELAKPLTPFLSQAADHNNGFWTSKMSEHLETFGYEYPDIIKGDAAATLSNFERLETWSLSNNPQAPIERLPLE